MIVRDNVKDFSLKHIFECGQCFRWNREDDGSYIGVVAGRTARISFVPCSGNHEGQLIIENGVKGINTKEDEQEYSAFWSEYLDLNRNYGEIKEYLATNDPVMKKAIETGWGIRILKQEPWETLISFIISQNNNIPRIKKCIEDLCRLFGEPLGVFRGVERFAFPGPGKLAGLEAEDLGPVKLGYRARYIIETSKAVNRDGVERLCGYRCDCSNDAFHYLCSLPGVGPKVANCMMLYGLEKCRSFPVDVWIGRAMNELYGLPADDIRSIQAFAKEKFGEYSGFAQQYLFYYITRKKAVKGSCESGSK